MFGNQYLFYLRDVWFYYHKRRAATELISVCDIFPPHDCSVGEPKMLLLENIYSVNTKLLDC